MFHVPERYRFMDQGHRLHSTPENGNNGLFIIPFKAKKSGQKLRMCVVCGDEAGWEHVSVSIKNENMEDTNRCPTWEEMCHVKNLFWDSEDCVIQYHPPESEYVSMHHYTLHLWRKVGSEFETPPDIMVGLNLKR